MLRVKLRKGKPLARRFVEGERQDGTKRESVPTLRKGSEGRGTLKGGRKSHGASASDVIRAL